MPDSKGYFCVSIDLQRFRTSTQKVPERDNGRCDIIDLPDMTTDERNFVLAVERVYLDSTWRIDRCCGEDTQWSKLYQCLTSPF